MSLEADALHAIRLGRIDLSSNLIWDIGFFADAIVDTSIYMLSFNSNKITSIGVLSGSYGNSLSLADNQIAMISTGAFSGLTTQLYTLVLSENDELGLNYVNSDVFSGLYGTYIYLPITLYSDSPPSLCNSCNVQYFIY